MVELPMFPLGAVLLPGAVLPLHVFEERYRTMVRDVLAADQRFGVVLIARGSEVGGGDERTDIGTVATITEVREFGDGRFALLAHGGDRLQVERWLPDDPYPVAEATPLVDGPRGDPEALRSLRGEVQRGLRTVTALTAELGRAEARWDVQLDEDPVTAGWQAAAAARLSPLDAHGLLAIDDPGERLRAVSGLLDDRAELLRGLLTS